MAKGLLISELADGGVYECQLSGLRVLIIRKKGNDSMPSSIEAYQYNPVTGQYQYITIRNHQLTYLSK